MLLVVVRQSDPRRHKNETLHKFSLVIELPALLLYGYSMLNVLVGVLANIRVMFTAKLNVRLCVFVLIHDHRPLRPLGMADWQIR